MTSSRVNSWSSKGGGLVGNGWVADACSPGTSLAGTGRSLDRPHRLTGAPVEDEGEALLGHLGERGDGTPLDLDVGEDRGRRKVVVPDAVMNELAVPAALAAACVERHDGLGEEVRSRPMTAVEVVVGRLHRQIDETEIRIGAEHGPHAGVAGDAPRVFAPGGDADLACPRNGVEDPQALAGAHVVAPHVGRRRLASRGPNRSRHLHHGDVADDGRRRGGADAGNGVSLVGLYQVEPEVDHAVLTERGEEPAIARVECDQPAVAGGV